MFDFICNHWVEIQTNLIASLIFLPFEIVVVVLIVGKVIQSFEDKRWSPARKNVAQKLCLVHRKLFNAAHYVIDPDFSVNKASHGLPDHFSQEAANYWGKTQFLLGLDFHIEALKKSIEYNNVALDSFWLPLISDFIVAADKLHENISFFIGAYDPSKGFEHHGDVPFEQIEKMEISYFEVLKKFPDLKDFRGEGPVSILSAVELKGIYANAARKNPRIKSSTGSFF